MNNVKEKINLVLKSIQERNNYSAKELNPELEVVADLGFVSLDVAELVAVLEMEIGVDPFSSGVSIMNVRTVGDLYRVYEEQLSVAC
ncbi:acyl carrier protein [Aliikangiella sp. IMCC44359]|uniref:acyl carrier protein n=1 Tax=Aliikangiella sp. IMCC44359 TaxID=3459125 RepID=UPI00403B1EDB